MVKKTSTEKAQLRLAKTNYGKLKKDKDVFNLTLGEVLKEFYKSTLPNWGGFSFNHQKI